MAKSNVVGLDTFLRRLNKLEDNLKDEALNKILNQLGAKWTGEIKLNFTKSYDPYGKKWPSLKAGGRMIKKGKKRVLDKSAKPLLDTGRLVGSINFNVKDEKLEIGTPVFYSQFHQNGEGVPKRAFLPDRGLPQSWKNDLNLIIAKVLNNLV